MVSFWSGPLGGMGHLGVDYVKPQVIKLDKALDALERLKLYKWARNITFPYGITFKPPTTKLNGITRFYCTCTLSWRSSCDKNWRTTPLDSILIPYVTDYRYLAKIPPVYHPVSLLTPWLAHRPGHWHSQVPLVAYTYFYVYIPLDFHRFIIKLLGQFPHTAKLTPHHTPTYLWRNWGFRLGSLWLYP